MISSKQEEKIINEIKQLIELFLKTNASDIELSEKTGISSSTVQRRLTDKKRITECIPNGEKLYEIVSTRRRINKENGKEKGTQNSILNNIYLKDSLNIFKNNNRLKLDIFCSNNLDKEMDLLFKLVLKYRVNLDSILTLFPYDSETILKYMDNYYNKNALEYLFYYDKTNQEIAMQELIDFYKEMIKTKKTNEYIELISKLDDSKCNNIRDILLYQMNNVLSTNDILEKFNLDKEEYDKKVYELLGSDPILKDKFVNLVTYMNKKKAVSR